MELDHLLHRICGEFREMPGLRLTMAQAVTHFLARQMTVFEGRKVPIFGGANPIGRVFYLAGNDPKTPIQIVGVAKDGKYADVREET